MEALRSLACEAGLVVQVVGRSDPDEGASASGVCRVRGRVWVVLHASDPLDLQLDVLAGALRTHAGPLLEGRWLPPAVRDLLSADPSWT